MSKIFVWSDSHFNHDRIIELSHRPVANVTEMNELMIARHNEVVGPGDISISLGDFAYPPKTEHHMSYDEIGSRLNGTKFLIRGNHCQERMKGHSENIFDHWMWEAYYDYHELKYGKSRFVLCHYPLATWRNAHHGWYMLHGHIHCEASKPGEKFYAPHRFDVGVDRQVRGEGDDMFGRPWNIDDLRDMLAAQADYKAESHHI